MPDHVSPDDLTDSPTPLWRLEEQLLRQEAEIARAFLHRTKLMGEIAARKRGGKSRSTNSVTRLEKDLWRIWEDILHRDETGRLRHWHQFFAQCNSLGYALGVEKSPPQDAWILRPRRPSTSAQLSAPVDMFAAQIMIFWAAVFALPVRLAPVALNDAVIDLIKALNQAGASLSWEQDSVTHLPGPEHEQLSPPRNEPARHLNLENKTIHVGRHEFPLALMLALALGRPGFAKFNGSGGLNMLQLKTWQAVFPQLGARLHCVSPHSSVLPARLESAGRPETVRVDAQTPKTLLWSLLAAAPLYPDGLRLAWPQHERAFPELETITALCTLCAIPFRTGPDGMQFFSAKPRLPQKPELPLDIDLCAMMLAWARVSGQSMTVHGQWPKNHALAKRYLELLAACGLEVQVGPRRICAVPRSWPDTPRLDIGGMPKALPLATALAFCAPHGCTVQGDQSLDQLDVVQTLARLTGRDCTHDDAAVRFHPNAQPADRLATVVEAPDAFWGMATVLLAFQYPGLSLTNPGELTTTWPQFWSVFKNVLTGHKIHAAPAGPQTIRTNANTPPEPSRRRKRV